MPPFAPDWAFFLDIDGTLLEIAPTPHAVMPHGEKIRLVERLLRAAGGAVALVSGRPISVIDELFAPLRLPAAGQHGVERRDAQGGFHRHEIDAVRLRRAADRIRDFAATHQGLVFEDKGDSVALHYRLAPALREVAHEVVEGAAAGLRGEFETQPGKMVIELKPAGRNKGLAVEDFMREPPFAGRTPVYIGDDLTDEYAFGTVNRLGGHSVKVGEGDTQARWRIGNAREVRDWLAGWVRRRDETA